MRSRASRAELAVVALAAVALAAGATAHAGRRPVCRQPAWHEPTPPAGTAVDTTVGAELRLEVSAYTAGDCSSIRIVGLGLPSGARLATHAGRTPRAVLTWRPGDADIGRVPITLVATELGRPHLSVVRTLVAVVHGPQSSVPGSYPVSTPGGSTTWAYVLSQTVALHRPDAGSSAAGMLPQLTSDGAWNLVPILAADRDRLGALWLDVPLAQLPDGTTGWVPATALGPPRTIDTTLVVDLTAETATLYKGGVAIWSAPVGVGAPGTPTPTGTFYVREELVGFDDTAYGPLAFGTNAVSASVTDWPGGGVVGIHGTDQPDEIPGAISHGCIRLKNADILALASLMGLGTPVVVR